MARRRVRLTVFSRFLLVLLFLVPAAFIGASYLNNQDPFETVKSWINGEPVVNNNTAPAPQPTAPATNTNSNNNDLASENQRLRERIKELEQQVQQLQEATNKPNKVGFE